MQGVRARALLWLSPLLVATAQALAQCPTGWGTEFGERGINYLVKACASFDEDGDGPNPPRLFIGGYFTGAGGTALPGLARWDGSTWSVVGSGLSGTTNALMVYQAPGQAQVLLAAGYYGAIGSSGPGVCAAWDGQTWQNFGGYIQGGRIDCLTLFNDGPAGSPPRLYAGGFFLLSGFTYTGVARLNDSGHWEAVDSGYGEVYTMAVFDEDGAGPNPPRLFIGGSFNNGGAQLGLKRFDGTTFTTVPGDGSAQIFSLCTADLGSGPALYAGGSFNTLAGQSNVSGVGRWNGTTWTNFSTGLYANPYVMKVLDDDGPGPHQPSLIAAGNVYRDPPQGLDWIMRWNGSSWTPLGGTQNDTTSDITIFDPDGAGPLPPRLIAVGNWTTIGSANITRVASWDGAQWSALGPTSNRGLNDSVSSMVVTDVDGDGRPDLVVAGTFTTAGDAPMNRVARWDGTSWLPVGAGFDDRVTALGLFDADGAGPNPPTLYAAGQFHFSGGNAVFSMARWNGTQWVAPGFGSVPTGFDAIVGFDEDGAGANPPRLFIGGNFSMYVGGITQTRGIARWNGVQWTAVGSGMDDEVNTMVVFDPDGDGPQPASLIAGGYFTHSGNLSIPHVARWDGTAWTAMGQGLDGAVTSLFVLDDDGAGPDAPVLYACGYFTHSGSLAMSHVARWTGTGWAPMGPGLSTFVYGLTSFDPDGDGPAHASLVAVGSFVGNDAGGQPLDGIARWDGSGWRHMDSTVGPQYPGINAFARCAVQFDDDGPGARTPSLFVAGALSMAGGHSSARIARYGPVADTQFTTQPADTRAYARASASFSVAVSGASPRIYQWTHDGAALVDGTTQGGSVISGSATQTLAISNVGSADAGGYAVIVSDYCGRVTSRTAALAIVGPCSADFDADADVGTDADIEAFFACLAGNCCATCGPADFNGDGDVGTDADIESFFRVLAGGPC